MHVKHKIPVTCYHYRMMWYNPFGKGKTSYFWTWRHYTAAEYSVKTLYYQLCVYKNTHVHKYFNSHLVQDIIALLCIE